MTGTLSDQVLREAINLLEDPEHWGQGATAFNVRDAAIRPELKSARRFCIHGAVIHVLHHRVGVPVDSIDEVEQSVMTRIAQFMGVEGVGDIHSFNDHGLGYDERDLAQKDVPAENITTHKQILEMLRGVLHAQPVPA